MYTPTLEQVKQLAKQGNLVPIYREVVADLETPVSAYLKIGRGPSFLLESVEGGERLARYSFIGANPYKIVRAPAGGGVDPLLAVEEELKKYTLVPVPDLPRFHGGAVGYLGYESIRHYEPRVPAAARDPQGVPEAVFLFCDTLLVFDHLKHKIKAVSHVHLDGDIEAAYKSAVGKIEGLLAQLERPLPRRRARQTPLASYPVASNIPQPEYEAKVERIKEYIRAGDCIQVVFSQRLSRRTEAAPFAIYRALRTINPSPYMYFLNLGELHLVGTSPELLVRVEDGKLDYHPIAGTRRRGATEAEDKALEAELRGDEKECAEHIMLLDLGRNDIGRVSEPGSVQVTQVMDVERYSHVMHLVSHVTGKLRGDLSPMEALRSCFPAGTVSGAPKIRAMEIIAALETDKRGPYAGAVGYFSFSGNLDTAICIRTMVMKDKTAHVQAGGGIVADSVPKTEHEESWNKARALLRAIDLAEEAPRPVYRSYD